MVVEARGAPLLVEKRRVQGRAQVGMRGVLVGILLGALIGILLGACLRALLRIKLSRFGGVS